MAYVHSSGERRSIVYVAAQWISRAVAVVIFHFRNHLVVHGAEHLNHIPSGAPVIIASNHRTRFDAFLIAASMPRSKYARVIPMRSITAEKYMSQPVLGFVLRLLGSFPNTEYGGAKAHARAERILNTGQTVLIFPEGKMTDELTDAPRGKVGAVWLARAVKEAVILPVKIQAPLRPSAWQLIKGGIALSVTFDEPYRPLTFHDDLQENADELLDRIYALQ